jgi:hypothetical protein
MDELVKYGLDFDKPDIIRDIKLKIKQAFMDTDLRQYDPELAKKLNSRLANWNFEGKFPGA